MKANELGISPAPWVYDDNREEFEGVMAVYDADGRFIVGTGDMEDGEWREIADARMMAAAPDLYDALTALCEALDDAMTTNAHAVSAAAREAREALTKAKEG